MAPDKKSKPGPEAERLVLPGNWKAAVRKALARGKPPKAEPKTANKPKRRSK